MNKYKHYYVIILKNKLGLFEDIVLKYDLTEIMGISNQSIQKEKLIEIHYRYNKECKIELHSFENYLRKIKGDKFDIEKYIEEIFINNTLHIYKDLTKFDLFFSWKNHIKESIIDYHSELEKKEQYKEFYETMKEIHPELIQYSTNNKDNPIIEENIVVNFKEEIKSINKLKFNSKKTKFGRLL